MHGSLKFDFRERHFDFATTFSHVSFLAVSEAPIDSAHFVPPVPIPTKRFIASIL